MRNLKGLAFCIVVSATGWSWCAPPGWPDGFKTDAEFINLFGEGFRSPLTLVWSEADTAYIGGIGWLAVKVDGANLNAQLVTMADEELGMVDLSGIVGGRYAAAEIPGAGGIGWVAFHEALGFEHISLQAALPVAASGFGAGMAFALLLMPLFELNYVFLRLLRDVSGA